jgi:16S rRNA (cytosine1402-N4)-methyltransferase
VNEELDSLKELLLQLPDVLKQGGLAAIITFHSLEDRLVKNFFKKGSFDDEVETDAFGVSLVKAPFKPVTKKPGIPGQKEMKQNPRSRSAKLRIAEKR